MMAAFDRFVHSAWAYAALAVFVFVAAAPGLASMPVLDRDEARFAQASAQMLETGDFVTIRYHDELRNKKPVGIHWLQSGAVALTSSAEARDIGAFRLPSLLGAITATLAAFWGGTALFNRRAAFLGAMLLGTTLILTSEAHIAKTDAALTGSIALAMAALAWLRRGAGRGHGVLFWLCMAAGVMIKGPIAPMVAGLAILALLVLETGLLKQKPVWARPLLYWLGPSLFLILTVPWLIAVQIATEGAFLSEAASVDLGQKIVGAAENHSGAPGYYLATLPLMFWPATLFLIPGVWMGALNVLKRAGAKLERRQGAGKSRGKTAEAVAKAWTEQEAAAWRFLACWVVPSWVVFEVVPTKLVHYTLPVYAGVALMAGAAADKWIGEGKWLGGRWLSVALFFVCGLAFAALTTPWVLELVRADAAEDFGRPLQDRVAWFWREEWNATGIGLWPALAIMACTLATCAAVIRKMPLATLGGLLACSLAAGISLRAYVLPNQSWMLATNAAISALNDICAAPEGTTHWAQSGCSGRAPRMVRAIEYSEPSFVFELGGRITLPPKSSSAIPPVSEDPRPAWLVNVSRPDGARALAEITAAAAAADRCVRLSRRHVINYSNGDAQTLVAAVVEPAGCPSPAPGQQQPAVIEAEPELVP